MAKKRGIAARGPAAGVAGSVQGRVREGAAAEARKLRPSPSAPWLLFSAAAVLLLAWWAYAPALHGPLLFDDVYLPFASSGMAREPLSAWVHGVRPVLMFSYWLNLAVSGSDTFSYHVFGLLIHLVTAGFVFLIVRRVLEWSGIAPPRLDWLAGFAAALFLLHPAQTEAVAYLAGRSEALSVMFAFAAFTVFVYREGAGITWARTAAVLMLFGLAMLSKEQTVALPALLLLTDYWWNPGFPPQQTKSGFAADPNFSAKGIRANWRIYVLMAVAAAAAAVLFRKLLLHAGSAGFGMKDLAWYQYLFTEFRAIFVYLGVFVLPVRLTADYDFPFSRTLLDHGAIFGLIALAALIGLAWHYRRRFPLAAYGFFVYLVLMAPTSSILPIQDPVAERRLYFSILGLLLIVVDLLARWKIAPRTVAWSCAAVALALAGATHARAALYGDPVAFWEDAVRKSPAKPRPHFQLAMAYNDAQRYDAAITEFEKTARLQKPNYDLLVDWALAYDSMNRPAEAVAKLQQAAALQPTAHVYSQIGMVYAKQRRWAQALGALNAAEQINPRWAPTYNYRAKIYFQQNQLAAAVADYRRALALDPTLSDARSELMRAQALLDRGGR
ncbi:MAG TPA: tetratricopeptide repeat protein [Bryobacteraceae bacterium]|nr:tetratricopeptide repeat protein [Bryobacteraceae bacterium]